MMFSLEIYLSKSSFAMQDTELFDAVIIGGSYAGLSAAMALGRAMRRTLVIDAGQPCNRQTPHSHNFLTRDGVPPAEIAGIAREQVLRYPTVSIRTDYAEIVSGSDNEFLVTAASGAVYKARKIILATGIIDLMPEIEGFAPCWGISVIHCPYCHGYEYRHQATGILANGDAALEFAALVSNWTDKLHLFTNGPSKVPQEHVAWFFEHNISIVEQELDYISHDHGQLKQLVFRDGSSQELDALYARLPFALHSDIHEKLGCRLTEGGYLEVDEFRRTSIAGVFAAGDATTPMRFVSGAVASGTVAGASVNKELILQDISMYAGA